MISLVQQIVELGSGEAHAHYLVTCSDRKLVFRIHLEKDGVSKSKREYVILHALSSLKIAPEPLLCDTSRILISRPFLILESVEGKALPEDYHLSDKEFVLLAKTLAKLHNLKVPSLKLSKNKMTYVGYLRRFESDLRYLQKKMRLCKVPETNLHDLFLIKDTLKSRIRLSRSKNTYSLVHGDIAPQNMVEKKEGFALIDWESAGFGDPAAEIVFVIDDIGFPITDAQKKMFLRNLF